MTGTIARMRDSLAVLWWRCPLWLLVLSGTLGAQPLPTAPAPGGASPVRQFSSASFGGSWDNYRVEVLADGRIAVSNDGGLAIHDGQRWRFTPHPDGRRGLIALALTPDQRLCGAFFDDPGCFVPQPEGLHTWVSQRLRLAPADRQGGRCMNSWYDSVRRGTWLIYTRKLLFLPDDPAAAVVRLEHPQGLSGAGGLDGRLWLASMTGSLVASTSEADPAAVRLEAQPAFGDTRSSLKGVQPGPAAGSRWFLWMYGKLLQQQGEALLPLASSEATRWRREKPMSLLRLRDGHYAIGFFEGPLRVLDHTGAVVETYGEAQGVPQVPTHGIAEDAAGGLWLAQSGGVVRLDRGSAASTWGRQSGLGSSTQMLRWQERTLLVSNLGLHTFDADTRQWQRLAPDLAALVTHAAVVDDELWVAGSRLLRFPPDLRGMLAREPPGSVFAAVRGDRAYLVSGNERLEARLDGDRLVERPLPPFVGSFASYLEQDARTLWAAARIDEVQRWQRDSQGGWEPVTRYAQAQGIAPGEIRLARAADGSVWAGTRAGLRRFDAAAGQFVDDARLPDELRNVAIEALYADDQAHWWVRTTQRLGVAWWQPAAQRWQWDELPLASIPDGTPVNAFWRDGALLWVLRADGVSQIALDRQQRPAASFPPTLAGLTVLPAERPLPLLQTPSLQRGQGLRARFGWPQWLRPEAVRWRSRLRGVDADFSAWEARAEREWSNLPAGHFALEAEARDAFGAVHRLTGPAVTVAPPWYLTRAAWVGYGLLGTGLLWLAMRLGTRVRQQQLLARQAVLERTVAERTLELDQKNRELADHAERLSALDRLKTRFFLNVGHEFRTPLTLILGPLEDLLRDRRERFSERSRSQLELAQRNAGKVLDLVVELMDVNRLEQGQFELRPEPVDLRLLLERVADAHRPLLERYGHTLVAHIGSSQVPARIDVLQLERALSNLISNAAKFMSRGGTITLGLAMDSAQGAGGACITVEDQGRGIPAAALPHVFDRFYQAEDSDRASGHGIGLALVHEIVQAHGGTIEVRSASGQGSTFTLRLPVVAAASVQHELPEGAASPARIALDEAAQAAPVTAHADARPCVLVIDDHDELRQRVRELLAQRFDVIEAADGERGWQRARDELPDLIVADVMMPGCDGVTLTRRLRQDPATTTIAILLLTAKAGSSHAVEGLRAGANDYLAKPFDAEELRARCDALLDHARRLRFHLQRQTGGGLPEAAPAAAPSESADERWRRRLRELIARRLPDPTFDVEAMAAAMHADRSQLFRRCKELLGASPSDLLREARLGKALELLSRDAESVSAIAYAVGYERLSSFTRAFVARYGHSPSEARSAASREQTA